MKLRLRYSKLGKVRFVSHRDGARLWERALRRVAVPVAYTEGFTPRPKLSFGLALPTGAESVAEYIDVDLIRGAEFDPGDLATVDGLSDALPQGMAVLAATERDPTSGSLQDEVTSTTWELTGPGFTPELLESAAQRLLAADELLVERERKGRRRVDDVRPLILDLAAHQNETALVAELATVGRALRPAELVTAAFPDIDSIDVRVLRTHQWIDHDGERREVLPLPAGVAALDRGLSA
ncbi:MAG: TIGR03936 family radical SAM-associated protein [Ilumatobacteraceae bacterium]